jgi:CRISPR-associated protein Cmr3
VSRATWLALSPRDTVLVRDGRQFDAGVDATAESGSPTPNTVAGAVGAAYGRRVDAVRGPVLARSSAGSQVTGSAVGEPVTAGWTAYFPTPRDLVVPDLTPDVVRRLRPEPAAAVTDLADRADRPLWTLTGDGEPLEGWLPGPTLSSYLRGELFGSGRAARRELRGHLDRDRPPLVAEARVGLARTAGRTARTGYLYQSTHLRPADGWAFLAECDLPDDLAGEPASPVKLGGRDRLADIWTVSGPPRPQWPPGATAFPDRRMLVYLATPAVWLTGWRLLPPPGARLLAAAVAGPQAVATAAPGPRFGDSRRLYWAVPAGSVYLLEFDDAARAAQWAAEWHGKAYGEGPLPDLRTAGFGVVLIGVWS